MISSPARGTIENAGLIYVLWISEQGGRHWDATEAGLTALANGDVGQRIRETASAQSARPAPTAERLHELETLRANGAITDTEYTAKRARIIEEL
jgi:Short C-terminal domain